MLVAPGLMLAEVAGAIACRTQNPGLGRRALEHILATPNLHLIGADATLSLAAAQLAAAQCVRGADAQYIAAARQLGIPLLSWDQEQISWARPLVEAYAPA